MKLVVLVENTTKNPALEPEFGLSLYVEWAGRRLLMDFGDHGSLVPNAQKLGVDLSKVEFGVLSHGHDDHSGGIPAFRTVNPDAPIYIQEKAFGSYWSLEPGDEYVYAGLDPALREDPNLRLCAGVTELGGGALIFDGITGRELFSEANRNLLEKTPEGYREDAFAHEQALILPQGSGYVLLGGCAHNGIVNIVERASALMGKPPAVVLSGFHLADPGTDRGYDPALVRAVARRLLRWPARYYTCHCTGLAAYGILKEEMGDAVDYAACGDTLIL